MLAAFIQGYSNVPHPPNPTFVSKSIRLFSYYLHQSRSAKVIPLHQGFCTCRAVKAKHRVTRSRNSVILSNLPKPANHQHTRGARGMSGSGLGQIDGSGFGGGGGGGSKHLLEIEVVGLKRRLWAAESKQECRRWVSSRQATPYQSIECFSCCLSCCCACRLALLVNCRLISA